MTHMDPGIRFPGESEQYRRERNRLLEIEAGLRRAIEQVEERGAGIAPAAQPTSPRDSG